jgi:ATP-dependent Lon protease
LSNKVFESVVDGYTRESGVRGLDKMVAKLVRYAAKSIAMEQEYNVTLNASDLKEILGAASFDKERQLSNDIPGVVTGLAWTAVGGDILFIESSKSPGKGKMSITGNLGNVMKESSTIAMQYIKSHAKELGINPEELNTHDIHLHVPEGATPKDGPSAGITMLTALVSLFTGRKVKAKLAMTGEITLRGKVLAVGGIKEKILAAKRAGVREIILCEQNKKDVDEINERYLKGLKFHYVSKMNDVIDLALI